ncbi:MAG: hypothetical protein ACXABY_13420, partial [Candidatus Thorarchaeota archaeon]
MGYTKDEVRLAVEKLVTPRTRFITDNRSGTRKVEVAFSDIQEAAASIMVHRSDVIFYLAELSSNRLLLSISNYRTDVQDAIDIANTLDRKVVEVTDTTALQDAKSALLLIESAISRGSTSDLSVSTSYSRFISKMDEFLLSVRPNVRHNGEIVPSIEEAMITLQSNVSGMSDSHSYLVERLKLLANVESSYSSLNLQYLVARSTVSRARKQIGTIASRIGSSVQSSVQKRLRSDVLDLLASKSSVKQISLFAAPSEEKTVSGTASVYADTNKPATPASAETIDGPFDIRDTSGSAVSNLDFTFDSGSTFRVELIPVTDSLILQGVEAEPFDFIDADVPAEVRTDAVGSPIFSEDQRIRMFVSSFDGSDVYSAVVYVTILKGPQTSVTIATEIQAELFVASMDTYFQASGSDGIVVISSISAGSSHSIEITSITDELRYVLGSWLIGSYDGKDKNNVLMVKAGPASAPIEQYFTFTAGTWTAEEVASHIMTIKVSTLPIVVTAVDIEYVTPQYKVVQIEVTSTEADAILELPSTYDPGGGDLPALANSVLGLVGALNRQSSTMSAYKLADYLSNYADIGTGNREIHDRSLITVVGDKVVVTTKDKTLASRVQISGDGCLQIFGSTSVDEVGTTGW